MISWRMALYWHHTSATPGFACHEWSSLASQERKTRHNTHKQLYLNKYEDWIRLDQSGKFQYFTSFSCLLNYFSFTKRRACWFSGPSPDKNPKDATETWLSNMWPTGQTWATKGFDQLLFPIWFTLRATTKRQMATMLELKDHWSSSEWKVLCCQKNSFSSTMEKSEQFSRNSLISGYER